ncbi:MAG: maleylacetoacetate isomerase, partial [Alphaproteobacteria bacterium]|nr:maleylacetoacetate isomerase [Alphaproteobacteria bacterium]
YDFFRSSAAYRVRIALNLKGLEAERAFVHLRRGEQFEEAYLRLNPQGVVPTLIDGEVVIGQSLAILEYLEETRPLPPLLPADPVGRARVRQLALIVACEVHPLNNLKVLTYLKDELGAAEEAVNTWYRHWVAKGLGAIEALLEGGPEGGAFCHGERPTLADVFLVPQVYNARRFDCDLSALPRVLAIDAACAALDAFRDAAPGNQPDAE